MFELNTDEKIYVFQNRIRLLESLLKTCQFDQNIDYFGFEPVQPFDPENPIQRLKNGIQDPRPTASIISEADALWQSIKRDFAEGIIGIDLDDA